MKVKLNQEMNDEFHELLDKWDEKGCTFNDVLNILEATVFSIRFNTQGKDWRQQMIYKINITHFGEGCPICGGKE